MPICALAYGQKRIKPLSKSPKSHERYTQHGANAEEACTMDRSSHLDYINTARENHTRTITLSILISLVIPIIL